LKPDHELDEEQEQDRRWFAANPGRRIYLRPARGWEKSEGDDMTVVAQIRPGVRIRAPFRVNPLICWPALNEDEGELRAALRGSPMAGLLQAALGGL
jgi:hypothetical protein